MNFLEQLISAGRGAMHPGQHPQAAAPQQQGIPVGQPIPHDVMKTFTPQVQQLAQLYQSNPMDPRVMGIDPKMFGYAPDNSQLGVAPQQNYGRGPNLGVSSIPVQGAGALPLQSGLQGGVYNPGFTPLQNSGYGPYGNPQRPTVNPQVNDNGYYWNN